jgi:hypothetical protein
VIRKRRQIVTKTLLGLTTQTVREMTSIASQQLKKERGEVQPVRQHIALQGKSRSEIRNSTMESLIGSELGFE